MAGNEMRVAFDDSATIEQLESVYREYSRLPAPHGLFLTDPAAGRVLSDRQAAVRDLFPGLGDVHITVFMDTVNA